MRTCLWVMVLGGCASAASDASLRDQYNAAMSAGQWPDAYVLAGDVACEEASLSASREMVQLWDRLGRPSEPVRRLTKCGSPQWLADYVRAMTAATRGDAGSALGFFDAAANALEDNREMRRDYAEIRYRQGLVLSLDDKSTAAIVALDAAADADPARVDIRIARASADLSVSGSAATVETLRGVLALSPSSRDLARAREVLRRAVRASQPPLSPETELQISEILSDIEKDRVTPEDATRLRGTLERSPHPRLRTAVGLVMLKLGRLSEGSHYLAMAATESPLDPEPPRSLGTTLHAAGRIRAALPYLRDAVERDPFDSMTLTVLAEAAAAADDVQTAAVAYERLSVLEPLDPENYLWIARMERKRGDLPSARRAVVRGCELVTRNIPLYLERASIEAQIALSAESPLEREQGSRRTRDAVAELLEIAPGHPGAQPILDSLAALD
ncbi:MAG: hypothetical protein AAF654_07405 [Myxococcota bacterium]